jgi:type IV pilus assembly protein PilY1
MNIQPRLKTSMLRRAAILAVTMATVGTLPARADDIDLFVASTAITGVAPNVLLILDNSANWNNNSQKWVDGGSFVPQGQSEVETLATVVSTLKDDEVNVGLMMLSDAGGGYMRFGARMMNPTNRPPLASIFQTMYIGGYDQTAQNSNYDYVMNSAFRYFNSKATFNDVISGDKGTKTDLRDFTGTLYNPTGSNSGATPVDCGGTCSRTITGVNLPGWPLSDANDTSYTGPSGAGGGCAKNFIIFIGNGFPRANGTATELTDAAALLGIASSNVSTSQIYAASQNRYADEWAQFMNKYGVKATDPDGTVYYNKIITYTIDVCKDACDSDQEKLLKSMASVGGGKYFRATSKEEIKNALAMIFAEIQAVNSVFTSATLPISVNTQGSYENQVYMGMFRPDSSFKQRWFGNMKQYQLAVEVVSGVTQLYLADRTGQRAISSQTGFIADSSTSFWTVAQTPGFWTFQNAGTAGADDSPDGPTVERGGAAFQQRNTFASGRTTLTCLTSTCLGADGYTQATAAALETFNTANATATALLVPSGAFSISSLVRSGTTATVTTSSNHGFAGTDSITITGVVPTDYNVTTAITVTGLNTFTYAVSEGPSTPATATLSSGAPVVKTASSISLSDGTNATTAATFDNLNIGGAGATTVLTATVTIASHGYTGTDSLTVGNATQAGINTSGITPGAIAANTFTYSASIVAPAAPTVNGTSNIGSTISTNGSVARNKNLVVVDSGRDISSASVVTAGTTQVTVAGVTPSSYNLTRIIRQQGTGCNGLVTGWNPVPTGGTDKKRYYCFNYYITEPTGAQVQAVASPVAVNLARAGSVVTATRVDAGVMPALVVSATDGVTQVSLSGSSVAAYDGTWTIATHAPTTQFTFAITTTPTANATVTSAQAQKGAMGAVVPAAKLINWVRGADTHEDENQDFVPLSPTVPYLPTEVRASIQGDVLHARPVVINYGSAAGSYGIVAFYGSNDGFLRSIKGGQTDADGIEKWAFIPEEFVNYNKLARMYNNSPLVLYPSTPAVTPTPTKRDYFWDGPIGVYQTTDTVNNVTLAAPPDGIPDDTRLMVGARRGGRMLYQLDVTNPDSPKFKWRINSSRTGYSELGYTWSLPVPITLKGTVSGTATPKTVVVFGGGYDPTQDDRTDGAARTATMGLGVFVADLDDGSLIAHIKQTAASYLTNPTAPGAGSESADAARTHYQYSFQSDLTPVDMDGDGYVDRIYAVDSGANIWRFDHDQTQAPGTTWKIYRIAALGDVGHNGGDDDRRFMYPVAVQPIVRTVGGVTMNQLMLLAGTGDREKPLSETIRDRFYAVIDSVDSSGWTPGTEVAATESNLTMIDNIDGTLNSADLTDQYTRGWYWRMRTYRASDNDYTYQGEKCVNAATVISGTVFFGTNVPKTPDVNRNVCSNLGEAKGYALNVMTGKPVIDRDSSNTATRRDAAQVFTGGGLPPTPTVGNVIIDGAIYRFAIGIGEAPVGTASAATGLTPTTCTGSDCGSTLGGANVTPVISGARSRVYWYYKGDQ